MVGNEAQNSEGGKPGLGDGFGLIDKAWEWNWPLRVASIVMFLDLALILRGGHGLLAWSKADDGLLQNMGFLAVAVAVFGLLAAILVPLAATVSEQILSAMLGGVLADSRAKNGQRYERPRGCVLAPRLHELALRENSEFLLKLFEEHERKVTVGHKLRAQLGNLVFGVLCLAMLDLAIPLIGSTDTSLMTAAMHGLGSAGQGLAAMGALGCVVMLKYAWFPDMNLDWVYYPPLADEIDAKEQAAREHLYGAQSVISFLVGKQMDSDKIPPASR